MSIFDKLKRKKPADKKADKGIAPKKEAKAVKQETMVTPDGKMVSVAKKAETKTKAIKPKKEDTGDAYRVLVRPLISEKGSFLGANNQYLFAVDRQANKIEIRKAIRKVYGVDPIKVNVINVLGKSVRYGRTEGMTKKWKKAVITLAPGQKIAIQEGL